MTLEQFKKIVKTLNFRSKLWLDTNKFNQLSPVAEKVLSDNSIVFRRCFAENSPKFKLEPPNTYGRFMYNLIRLSKVKCKDDGYTYSQDIMDFECEKYCNFEERWEADVKYN